MIGAARKASTLPLPARKHPGLSFFLANDLLARDARGNSFPLPCVTCGKFGRLQIIRGIHRLTCVQCAVVSLVEVRQVREGWQIRSAAASAA